MRFAYKSHSLIKEYLYRWRCVRPSYGFSRIARKQLCTALLCFHLPYPRCFPHFFAKVLILGHARSGHQVRSNNITMQKTLQSRHNYNVRGNVMKLSEYDKVVGTYKAYVLNFLYL